MKFFKKKLNISLLLLLALLFTSLLSTTSLAYSYTITNGDIDLIVDYYIASSYRSEFKSRLKTQLNDLYNVQHFDTCVVSVGYDSSSYWVYLYGFNASNVTNVSNSKNINYMGISLSTNGMKYGVYRDYVNYSNTWRSSWSGSNFGTGAQLKSRYLCVPNDLGLNGSLFSGPWQSTNIITFAPSEYFTFLLNSSLGSIEINGDNVPVIDINGNQANNIVLGELGLAELYDNTEVFRYRYDRYYRNWRMYDNFTISNIGSVSDNLIDVTIYGYDIPSTYMTDTIIVYQMNPNPDWDGEDGPYSQPFYIKSANTYITNGALDYDNTFSGDYYDYYNKQIDKQIEASNDDIIQNQNDNTQDIINNINDDSQVEAILSDTFSSSGDLFNAFGFIENFDNPFVAFLYTILNGICDSLLDDGNVTLDLNFHGSTQFLVNSDDIYLPNGLLKSLISSALVFGVIYIYYRWAYSIVLSIQTANIEDIKEKLGHDEFYDTDYF